MNKYIIAAIVWASWTNIIYWVGVYMGTRRKR